MITTILFDLGNVIVDVDHAIHCRRFSKICGHSVDELWTFMLDQLMEDLDAGRLPADEFHHRLEERFALGLQFDQFAKIFNEIFVLKLDTVELLRELRILYRLGLVSNTNPMHWTYIKRQWAIHRMFQTSVVSFEVGAVKPEPHIYREAARRFDVSPEQCIYFDDRQDLVDGARAVGMHGVQFTDAEAARQEIIEITASEDGQ